MADKLKPQINLIDLSIPLDGIPLMDFRKLLKINSLYGRPRAKQH